MPLLAKVPQCGDWAAADKRSTLVIVESPAKARTIQKFVDGDSFVIDFCAGHIRDLAKKLPTNYKSEVILPELRLTTADFGIDIHNSFKPIYVPMDGKSEVIKRLSKLAKSATRIILATDEDREGEAISWHLVDVLKPTVPFKVLFNL